VLAAELTNFYEYAMCGKWLSLLKELAPSVARVAVLQNPDHPSWAGYRQSIATAAPSLGVEIASGVRSPAQIDIAIDALARAPAGGLLVLPDTFNTVHRDRIVAAAVRHCHTAIYPSRFFAAGGGLIPTAPIWSSSCGSPLPSRPHTAGRHAARSSGPVINKFELVINLKTAKALGLDVSDKLLARADEVIE
jgi:putative ABC transport system substrate-binding protein